MRMQLLTKLSEELDVINEKQLKCLYSNESSLGNKVKKLELLGQDTKQDTEERNTVKQKCNWNIHNCGVQHCKGFGRSFWKKQMQMENRKKCSVSLPKVDCARKPED